MKDILITLTMTEQEAEWLEQACFVEEDYPHSKFLNHVSNIARRARQRHAQRTAKRSAEAVKRGEMEAVIKREDNQ